MDRGACWAAVQGVTEQDMTTNTFAFSTFSALTASSVASVIARFTPSTTVSSYVCFLLFYSILCSQPSAVCPTVRTWYHKLSFKEFNSQYFSVPSAKSKVNPCFIYFFFFSTFLEVFTLDPFVIWSYSLVNFSIHFFLDERAISNWMIINSWCCYWSTYKREFY